LEKLISDLNISIKVPITALFRAEIEPFFVAVFLAPIDRSHKIVRHEVRVFLVLEKPFVIIGVFGLDQGFGARRGRLSLGGVVRAFCFFDSLKSFFLGLDVVGGLGNDNFSGRGLSDR
jgi:hypothetical protein